MITVEFENKRQIVELIALLEATIESELENCETFSKEMLPATIRFLQAMGKIETLLRNALKENSISYYDELFQMIHAGINAEQ